MLLGLSFLSVCIALDDSPYWADWKMKYHNYNSHYHAPRHNSRLSMVSKDSKGSENHKDTLMSESMMPPTYVHPVHLTRFCSFDGLVLVPAGKDGTRRAVDSMMDKLLSTPPLPGSKVADNTATLGRYAKNGTR
jgi:hypothetical protein